MYFLESKKGVLFSASTPCALIILFANCSGLFNPKGTPPPPHPVKIVKP
jgi:hypothetical protein